jgi:hypothetical protein
LSAAAGPVEKAVAVETGLRAGELRSLVFADFVEEAHALGHAEADGDLPDLLASDFLLAVAREPGSSATPA